MRASLTPICVLISALLLLLTASPAVAQDKSADKQEDKPSGFPKFDDVVKDLEPVAPLSTDKGLLTLYRHKADDRSKDQGRLLARVPASLLNQDLLLAVSFSRGSMAGFMWNDHLVRFRLLGNRLVIESPDSRYVNDASQPVNDAIERTYQPSILAAMPLVTMAGSDPVVDLGPILLSGGLVARDLGRPDRALSEYAKVKVFADNLLIDTSLAMPAGSGFTKVGVSYGLRRLPARSDYKPRMADERVGYFTTVQRDWTVRHTERETVRRFVNRWHLEKRDPSLQLSPPKQPIVFIIEKTVPIQWRRWVRDGILEWNKAFEEIGYVDAIVVQQQTDDNEYANHDPEDARHNFIRWIVTGGGFAAGPSRVDPRTGQILDADIIIDDAFLRYFARSTDIFAPRAQAALAGPELLTFLQKHPQFLPAGAELPEANELHLSLNADAEPLRAKRPVSPTHTCCDHQDAQGAKPQAAASHHLNPHMTCGVSTGMQLQLALAHAALVRTPTGKELPERMIGEMLKAVITHEVGHTLGLRHNFKASAWLPLAEIKRRRDTTDEPVVASVMDYDPLLFFPGDEVDKVRHFVNPTIGPYDRWAIQFGYRTPGKDDGSEADMLKAITAQSTKREHAYAPDEDVRWAYSPDPLANRWDMSADLLEWARMRNQLSLELQKDLLEWAVKQDEPSHYVRAIFDTLLFEQARNMQYVARIVGGQHFNRHRKSDPDAQPTLVLVPAAEQRAALNYLGESLFSESFFQLDPATLNELAASRWWDWTNAADSRIDYPVHQRVLLAQSWSLLMLCAPDMLQRIYDAQLKTAEEKPFTLSEHVTTLRDHIWSELADVKDQAYTDAAPLVRTIRRNLQAQHLTYMLLYANQPDGYVVSGDVQRTIRLALRDLSDRIDNVLKTRGPKLDFASRAHLTESKNRIDRTLDAVYLAR